MLEFQVTYSDSNLGLATGRVPQVLHPAGAEVGQNLPRGDCGSGPRYGVGSGEIFDPRASIGARCNGPVPGALAGQPSSSNP